MIKTNQQLECKQSRLEEPAKLKALVSKTAPQRNLKTLQFHRLTYT